MEDSDSNAVTNNPDGLPPAVKQAFQSFQTNMKSKGLELSDITGAYHGYLLYSKEFSEVNIQRKAVLLAGEGDGRQA